DKIEIRTLGMLEIVKAHTASNLKEEIENLSKKYNICLTQIYSITVDNGANMIKTVEMIAEEQLITHIDLSEDAFSEYLLQNRDNESSQEYNDSSQPNNDYNNIEITQENNSDISNIHDNDSSGELWDRIDAYLTILSPVNLCTIKLQEKSCTIGDFFKLWLECKLDLEEINNESSNNLIKCLDYRQKYLFDNNVFRSYMVAREHLMSTWRQIQIFNKPKDNPALNVYLERESANAPIYQNIEILDMNTKINALIYGQKLPSDQNILQYWQSKIFQDPELYALSRVVLAAPCSQ
ncbi:unnamed protein product, partial [Gordionus sp. m RMFG-2023]